MEGFGSRFVSTVTQNEGELAEGNFPLSISGNSGYQAELVSDTLFLLHDDYLDIYSLHGDDEDSRQHAFQNASISAAGKYALIYERDGTSFRLDTKSKNIYSKTVDENIITGVVSDSGSVALVTESTAFACSIVVYDSTGKRLYQRNCTDRVIDVVFHEDSDGCCFTTISAENGVVQSTVNSVLFDQVDTQWTSHPLDTLVVKTEIASDGTLCVIGNTLCAYYSSSGEVLGTYTYNGMLLSAAVSGGKLALILQDDQKRQTSLVMMNQSAEDPEIVSLESSASYVQVADGDAFVMCSGSITSYDFSGSAIATVGLEDSYTSFLKKDGYIFLLGYNQIDRVDFKE